MDETLVLSMTGIEQLHKPILKYLGAVYPPAFLREPPSAGSIGDHFNGIVNIASGSDTSGKIRYSAIVFSSAFIWYETSIFA